MFTQLTLVFQSDTAWVVVWFVLYPAFNVAMGYLTGRVWGAALPLLGVFAVLLLIWTFGSGGRREIVLLVSFLVLGSLCVALGVAIRKWRTGERHGGLLGTAAVATACVAFLVCALALELFVAGDPECEDFKLRPVAGRSGDVVRYDGRSERVFVADNAARCGSLNGMTASQVHALFGGDEVRGRGWQSFDLGYDSIVFGAEYHYIEVYFDPGTELAERARRSDVTD